jgi:hypothetical protein
MQEEKDAAIRPPNRFFQARANILSKSGISFALLAHQGFWWLTLKNFFVA